MDPIDWTGVAQRTEDVAPLCALTFVTRLNLLSKRAGDIATLRRAFLAQQEELSDKRISGNPESSA